MREAVCVCRDRDPGKEKENKRKVRQIEYTRRDGICVCVFTFSQ